MLRKYIEAKRQSADAEEIELITDEVLDNIEVTSRRKKDAFI